VSNLLIFLGASVLIMGVVIAFEKNERAAKPSPGQDPAAFTVPGESHGAEALNTDNGLRPNYGPTTGSGSSGETHPVVTPPVEPVRPAPAPQYVGDSSYKYYHRLNCKNAQLIPQDQKVFFASSDDAFAKGYIPCKICKPQIPTGDGTSHATTPAPKPLTPAEKPLSLPVKDVQVSFPYQVVERQVPPEKGFVRVELTVEVDNPLMRENSLRLAQKLVAAEIAKQKVNSICIFIRKKVTSRTSVKWFCMVDWAPYGNLTRETEVAAGDYRTHQFSIFTQGTYSKP
jgi:hypothetical protein